MTKTKSSSLASLQVQILPDSKVILRFEGPLDAPSSGILWPKTMMILEEHRPRHVIVQAGDVIYCDGSGLSLLFELKVRAETDGFRVEIQGLKEQFQQLLNSFDVSKFTEFRNEKRQSIDSISKLGQTTADIFSDLHSQVVFLGKLCVAMINTMLKPNKLRWKDMFLTVELAGVNAVGIVVLLGFLFGLIMAFSSAMPMRQFGVDIYVADLVAMALVRVLGPFITAIILAGRSGSAFAAELGTMKINEEIDALKTMGLNPINFLVVPRVLATVVVTPLLAILTNLAGLIGCGVVMLSLGFPLVTYLNRVKSAIDTGDIFAGLFKALVYGGLVSGVGCLRGLQTKTGASAVGISTTRAVVSSIILIVVVEGIFAVLYYHMGI